MSLLLPGISHSQDTLICDNGGFEDDFDYYLGFYSYFVYGSNTCTPQINGNPVVFTSISMPDDYRFEIATQGIDHLTNYQRVKFGEKSLLLNNEFSEFGDCSFDGGVNRITKRFKVTQENRYFTIWYSAVLQNPGGHNNLQPFFSIRCDLAPNDDLCWDGISFPANTQYPQGDCFFFETDHIKTSDWACHRIFIPKEFIGEIATLEITAADCGAGAHFGYVYIDGICEPCDSSSYGSGKLKTFPELVRSCDGDSITISGYYTLPNIDGDFTHLDSITVPSFNIYDLDIDTATKTFSFKIIYSDFNDPECRDVIAYLYFSDGSDQLPPVPTNGIEICLENFVIPFFDIETGSCNNNGTPYVLSDDYYFVTVYIDTTYGNNWTLHRLFDDILPGESGNYQIKQGAGDTILILGPFMIQEGSWSLILNVEGCDQILPIIPPDFCGACTQFNKTKIYDIACNDGGTANDPSDDTWSFKIVAYRQGGGSYKIYKSLTETTQNFNGTYTVSEGLVKDGCVKYFLKFPDPECIVSFIVCPPKPCSSGSECALEAYITDYEFDCEEEEFYVNFNVTSPSYLCYQTMPVSNLGAISSPAPFSNPLGPFTEDMVIKFSVCSTSSCSCTNPECYKYVYVPYFEEECPESLINSAVNERKSESLYVFPNPIAENELTIYSPYSSTNFEIYNLSDQLIHSGQFTDRTFKLNFDPLPGVYILKYRSGVFDMGVVKFIKF
jgi:hypothetical protein